MQVENSLSKGKKLMSNDRWTDKWTDRDPGSICNYFVARDTIENNSSLTLTVSKWLSGKGSENPYICRRSPLLNCP